ncbi:hypothetical protein DXG01_014901 [Tephrocybe rancida]|nr:hypothetical protein DXG01_014901 [Tephrocybe rancida]
MHLSSSVFCSLLCILWFATTETQAAPVATVKTAEPSYVPICSSPYNQLMKSSINRESAAGFIQWLNDNPNHPLLSKTPIFWSGKIQDKADKFQKAEDYAKNVVLTSPLFGPTGGVTIFQVIKEANFEGASQSWKPATDWTVVSQAFAHHVKPTSKNLIFVYYQPPTGELRRSIWSDYEWPAITKNGNIKTVQAYQLTLGSDGKPRMGDGRPINMASGQAQNPYKSLSTLTAPVPLPKLSHGQSSGHPAKSTKDS